MAKAHARTQPCSRDQALTRLAQAESLIMAAELVLGDRTDTATPGVAAALSVLAGIAGSDAACCAKLRVRARGQSHDEAVSLVAGVVPHGEDIAKDLKRLLDRKDAAHYGLAFVGAGEAGKMVEWARRLIGCARSVVET